MQVQARRQDLAAGGPKYRRRGQNQKGGHIFKIQYWMYVATGEPNVKWGAPISNGGAGHHCPPRWRRPCASVIAVGLPASPSPGLGESEFRNPLIYYRSLLERSLKKARLVTN